MFRLQGCCEDDTIYLFKKMYVHLRVYDQNRSCWRRSGFVCVYSKRHPYKYLHECLLTVIDTVLSVQVYYYTNKNITTIKICFF